MGIFFCFQNGTFSVRNWARSENRTKKWFEMRVKTFTRCYNSERLPHEAINLENRNRCLGVFQNWYLRLGGKVYDHVKYMNLLKYTIMTETIRSWLKVYDLDWKSYSFRLMITNGFQNIRIVYLSRSFTFNRKIVYLQPWSYTLRVSHIWLYSTFHII